MPEAQFKPELLPLSSDSRFFIPKLATIPPTFSNLLEQYSNIKKPSQLEHVIFLRNQAYKSRPYPCLGRFRFLDLDLSSHPLYSQILYNLKSDESQVFLDFGCCVGQDIRKLIFDGAPIAQIYGSDVLPAFIDIGYDLFLDQSKFPRDHFLAPADAFDDSPANKLAQLDGKVSILHISAVFHLFGLETQQKLAQRCFRLLNRESGKCLILGGQTANVNAGEYPRREGSMRWRHNSQSWQELWEKTAVDNGHCKVKVESHLEQRDMVKGKWEETAMETDSEIKAEGQKVIGLAEEGFRWMTWWVCVDFAE